MNRKSADASTTVIATPAAAAAPSSFSTSCADAPCGAPESTSQCGAERNRSIAASIDTKSSSGYAGAKCANVFATGSPAWLDETTRTERKARMRVEQAQEFAGNVAGPAEHDRGVSRLRAAHPAAFASRLPRPMLAWSKSPSSAE